MLDTIPNKKRSHSKLENLTLTHSKIYEIKSSFGIEENDYRNLISVLFTSDLFVNEITETLAFNYAIYTQDVIPLEKKHYWKRKQHYLLLFPFHLFLLPLHQLKRAN